MRVLPFIPLGILKGERDAPKDCSVGELLVVDEPERG